LNYSNPFLTFFRPPVYLLNTLLRNHSMAVLKNVKPTCTQISHYRPQVLKTNTNEHKVPLTLTITPRSAHNILTTVKTTANDTNTAFPSTLNPSLFLDVVAAALADVDTGAEVLVVNTLVLLVVVPP